MAGAQQVAATRVAMALAIVTDKVRIVTISKKCRVTTDPDDVFQGTFGDVDIDDPRIPFFRDILSDVCPEVGAEIDDEENFPLASDMVIQVVVDAVAALLASSEKWNGQCLPQDPTPV